MITKNTKSKIITVIFLACIGLFAVACSDDSVNTDSGSPESDAVAADKAALAIVYTGSETSTAVYRNITLPTGGPSGTSVTWESGAPATISATGIVIQPVYPSPDSQVTLTATISKFPASDTKVFLLTVKRRVPVLKTYQATCWDAAGTVIACTGTGQDGEFQAGRDTDFTGPVYHSTYTNDYTTTDNATGLIWTSCVNGQSGATCTGTATKVNWDTASNSTCSGLNTLNSGDGYAGISTWRLPTDMELDSLLRYDLAIAGVPMTFTAGFPNAPIGNYWSLTEDALDTADAWNTNFLNGATSSSMKVFPDYIRCTGKSPYLTSGVFTDNGDGTVLDHATGLVWQKCSAGQNNDSTCSGTASPNLWTDALAYCNSLTLGGRTWALPNINELKSIVDRSTSPAAINSDVFPATKNDYYWTSSTYVDSPSNAWFVNFSGGSIITTGKNTGHSVRCVSGL